VLGRLYPLGIAVLAAVLAAPAAHGAAPRVSGTLVAGPELAGSRVAWAESRGAADRIRLAGGGSRPATIQHTRDRGLLLFDASPAVLAFDWARRSDGGRGGTIFHPDPRGGPLRGPYRPLAGCREEFNDEAAPRQESDLDGTLLLRGAGLPCSAGFVIDDLASGNSTPVDLPGRDVSAPMAIAGRFIAFVEQRPDDHSFSWVTVWDRAAGREVYRTSNLPIGIPGIDLQPDGTLALGYVDESVDRTFGTSRVDWYSVAEPRQHRLPYSLTTPAVRISGDRILVEKKRPQGRRELALLGLRGGVQSVARFGRGDDRGYRRVGDFDFDGTRVAFARRKLRLVRVRRHGRVHLRRKLGPVTVELRRP
jgi:hypothetical protein